MVLLIFQFYQVCYLGKFVTFGLVTIRREVFKTVTISNSTPGRGGGVQSGNITKGLTLINNVYKITSPLFFSICFRFFRIAYSLINDYSLKLYPCTAFSIDTMCNE